MFPELNYIYFFRILLDFQSKPWAIFRKDCSEERLRLGKHRDKFSGKQNKLFLSAHLSRERCTFAVALLISEYCILLMFVLCAVSSSWVLFRRSIGESVASSFHWFVFLLSKWPVEDLTTCGRKERCTVSVSIGAERVMGHGDRTTLPVQSQGPKLTIRGVNQILMIYVTCIEWDVLVLRCTLGGWEFERSERHWMEFKITKEKAAQQNKMLLFWIKLKNMYILTLASFSCPFGVFHHFCGSFEVLVAAFHRQVCRPSQRWTELFRKTCTARPFSTRNSNPRVFTVWLQ